MLAIAYRIHRKEQDYEHTILKKEVNKKKRGTATAVNGSCYATSVASKRMDQKNHSGGFLKNMRRTEPLNFNEHFKGLVISTKTSSFWSRNNTALKANIA